MLETVDLEQKLSKSDYKRKRPQLQQRLYALQRACQQAGIPVIIVLEGWAAAGKGAALKVLTQQLDPRGITIHDIQDPRTYETHMPWLQRFWLMIPASDEIAIFHHSWYERVLSGRVDGVLTKHDLNRAYRDIANFERTLADDGYIVIKSFFHISKEEQARRFAELQRDPLSNWQIRPDHWERHEKYEQYTVAVEEMLKRTEATGAPWIVIAATDPHWTRITLFETIIHSIEKAFNAHGFPLPAETSVEVEDMEYEANVA
jgi:polyphosphate kinase 2 (PPK2 family)